MSCHRIHLSILLGVLLSAWEPVIGIEAVPQPSPSTTWQVLHAAFHKYGISPYPDFIPWQSSAPGPAPAAAGQSPSVPDHHAAGAAGQSSLQCSASGTCPQPDAALALPPVHSTDAATADMQQPPPTVPRQGNPAAANTPPAAVQVSSSHQAQPPSTAASSVSGTQQHPADAAAAASAAAPIPTDTAAHSTSQPVAPAVAAATGVQTAVQPHAVPTPAPAAAPTRLHRPPPVRRLLNLAELSDGASVLAANPEARRPERAIDRDIDSFMKNDCDAEKWMIIELSQLGTVETVKLTMKELYSSRVHTFRVLGRSSHPRKDGPDFTSNLASGTWQLLGSFTAENKRGMQSFSLPQRSRVRYLLLMFDTHYGNEQMCAMNWIEVLGVSAAQELEEALALQELEVEHEDHHAHTHHDHMQQQLQQQVQRHGEQPQPQVPAVQGQHTQTQELPPSAAEQPPHIQQAGLKQQHNPTGGYQQEQLQQQQGQAVPLAQSPDVAVNISAGAAQGLLAEQAAAATVPGADGGGSSQAVGSSPPATAATAKQELPCDKLQQQGSKPHVQDSTKPVQEPPSGTGHPVTPAAAGQQQDSKQQQGQQQQQPSAADGNGSKQGQGGSVAGSVVPQPQASAPGAGSPTGAPAKLAPDPPAQGSSSQGVGQGGAKAPPSQQPDQQQQAVQALPPQQQQAAAGVAKEVHTPGAAAPVEQPQQQHQAAHVALDSRPAAAAAWDVVAGTGTGVGQDGGTAGYTAGHTAAGVPQQQQVVQTGPVGQGGNGKDHHMPPPRQQHQQQQPPAQNGQSGNGAPRNGGDSGSVLDSRGSNKPKQAGNLFDVVKGEMMQLKLDQGKLSKKVDGLTKRSSDFDATAAALQQQQAALSAQVERLSKKLDALIGTQAAAAAAQQQLRKDVSMLLAAQKEQGSRQRVRYPHSPAGAAGPGAGYGVGPDRVLSDLRAAGQPGVLVDAPGRALLPPVCARLPGDEPPLLLQSRYQWSVVTALAGTSLLGLWLVLHPKSWGMPQVLRLVVCVLALLNGILAVLLGLWLLVMQGLASQAQVLLTADPRLSVPVHRMLSNGSGWGDAPQ